jgi:hypothetical protein
MKDAEDEAFDELAKRQGHWGGGYQAKRQMAADKQEPAQEPVAHLWECLGRWSAYLVTNGKQADCAPPSWLVEAIRNATTPPKRPWVGLTPEETSGFTSQEMIVVKYVSKVLKEKNT